MHRSLWNSPRNSVCSSTKSIQQHKHEIKAKKRITIDMSKTGVLQTNEETHKNQIQMYKYSSTNVNSLPTKKKPELPVSFMLSKQRLSVQIQQNQILKPSLKANVMQNTRKAVPTKKQKLFKKYRDANKQSRQPDCLKDTIKIKYNKREVIPKKPNLGMQNSSSKNTFNSTTMKLNAKRFDVDNLETRISDLHYYRRSKQKYEQGNNLEEEADKNLKQFLRQSFQLTTKF